MKRVTVSFVSVALWALVGLAVVDCGQSLGAEPSDPAPSAKDWAAVAALPDWSGSWTPDTRDQGRRETADPIPWTPEAARQIKAMAEAENAGRPRGLFIDCLPEGMPSWMLISHNAFEALFSPGRVTLLGESDANRIRRIYTDGRSHEKDPDPSFHGESIGHWEGQTLVVDTIGVFPQTLLAISEAVGLPNDGGLHVVERIHLTAPDTLIDELEITAPHILTQSWKTQRIYYRRRGRLDEVIEGVCLQGAFKAEKDAAGNDIFTPRPLQDGNPAPVN